MIRAAPGLVVALMALPVAAGLAGAVLPAFGYFPALGGADFSLAPWRDLAAWPGLGSAVRLSIVTGLGATVISLAITLLIVAAWQGTRSFRVVTSLLAPLLSLPHAAAAFGLAFLIAPSGWVARALSPWATGWDRPPDLLIVNDQAGLALIAGLVLKEVPFLMLMTLAALGQTDSARRMAVARSLGYGRVMGWAKTVLPAVYRQIRLPVFAVLAYSMSVVDVALILGPTRPNTLAVQVLDWMTAPDLTLRFTASAGAVLQLLLVLGALAVWILAERIVAARGRLWAGRGARGQMLDTPLRTLVALPMAFIGLGVGLGLTGLALWSVAGLWRFPDLLPQSYGLRVWTDQSAQLVGLGRTTALLAGLSALIALVLTIAHLQAGASRLVKVIYIPLLVPQIAFLPGLSALGLWLGLDGTLGAVLAVHLVFVLPYVALSLSDPWQAWDHRAGLAASALGAGPWRVLVAVRLPMILRALCIAFAVGFATSVAQYLPTLLIGAGRVGTLTTEAVALAASGNRRLIGVWAVMQMALPMVVFALALALPALIARRRRGLKVA
ncbi:Inner membrane ABC transporter permease protein YnjC [Roseibaca ekhonensis]|jgi:putative thiamine transport system permease protein|uniref:Inner membrane ABC transporter permease protein YnjC n=1 Tax=Roseinatronobacter ekhonensis TaxID=254356 RepID=A0A3B0MQW2_9RHOB|nr:ABC transporter permease [Roseibaca ekhonensis]SUZ30346.1 Inner membrane ABC transporter permease protein YnjC [Roseibaca ekhonensis]